MPNEPTHADSASPLPPVSWDLSAIRRFFEDSPDARLELDASGRIVEVNAASLSLLGYSREALIGQPLFFLCRRTHEDLRERHRETNTVRTACRLHVRSGSEMEVEFTTYRVGDSGYFVELRPLPEEYQWVRENAEFRILFEDTQRISRSGTWSFVPAENEIRWSSEVFRIVGISMEKGEPGFDEFLQRIHPADSADFLSVVERALKNGDSYTIKHRFLRPDGSICWVQSSGSAIFDDGHRVVKLIGTVQDVTEQEVALQANRAAEERLRFHIQQSPLAYIEWDMNFKVSEWNPAAERIFGYSREEALGAMPPMVPEDEQEHIDSVIAALLRGEMCNSINTNRTKDGRIITCEWFNTPLRSDDGAVVGISSIVQDISRRIEVENALLSYTQELKQARDQAESATRAKSAFLANMSHEIRTPLNGVIGMASLLQETELTDEQKEFASTIVASSESLLAIINDILDFSKIEAGKIELEKVPFVLIDVIEGSLDMLAARAAEKRLELTYHIDENLPPRLCGDPTRIRQIIINLLSNGVKFTESGEIEVRVGGAERGEGRYDLHLSVRDTGIGIPLDKKDRLFQSFSQVDVSTTRKYGGTGLGLSICFKLAYLMGGTIWVESEEGQGSTFHCTLVVEHAEATSPERALLFPVAPRIVLVEPHAHARMALAHRLAGMNVCVEACASVEEAERALLFGRPAALLSGYSSGVEFERLRDLSTRVGLPILTMLWVSEAANARAIGAERVLYRPVRSTPLFTKLRDAATRTVSFAPSPDPEGTASREVLIRIAHPLHQKILAKMLTEQGSSVGMVPSLEAWSADSRRTECLTFFDLETVEDALLADPCRRFDEGSSRLVVVAMALDRTRRQKLESAGVAAFLALPVQPAALQRVLVDASETRRATLRPNDAPVTS